MTFLDATDAEIALEVLKRLHTKGLRSLRMMADACPVSRGTLARWQKEDYAMTDPLRLACVEWLDGPAPDARPLTEEEEKLIAAKWMDAAAARLREEATASRPVVPAGKRATADAQRLRQQKRRRAQGE